MGKTEVTMGDQPLSERDASELASLFRLMADPARLQLVVMLADQERCVHELCEQLGLEQSAVSHKLRTLRDRGMVRSRREGRHIFYTLEDVRVVDAFECFRQRNENGGGRR